MRTKIRLLPLLLAASLFFLSPMAALSDTPALRGYDPIIKYQYVTFGEYPTQKDGTREPTLWRVLGVQDGVALLMTEYIIDFLTYNDVKDKDLQNPLAYADSLIRKTSNEQCVNDLFTEAEKACLVEMADGRGLLSVANLDELRNKDHGFFATNYTVDKRRQGQGTPYAKSLGLQNIDGTGNSWYWTTEWRKPGYRWIVGDNGHISTSGIDRKGGYRPVCYVRMDLLTAQGGGGEKTDPLRLKAR